MRYFGVRAAGLVFAALALAGCHPPRGVRPPYHEPVVAAPTTEAPTQKPEPPAR